MARFTILIRHQIFRLIAMKKGSKFLGALLLCISMLMVSCSNGSSDEASTRNEVVMDGKEYPIIGARMEDVMTTGNTVVSAPIDLYLDEDGNNFLSVECRRSDFGKTIDLTSKGNWRIEYNNAGKHRVWWCTWNGTTGESTTYKLEEGSRLRIGKNSVGACEVDVTLKWVDGVTERELTGHYNGKLYNDWMK